jgi:tetratricopeptide (TPR) repeat protein
MNLSNMNLPCGLRWGALCALLACSVFLADARAQQNSNDYYAPRKGSSEETFQNVQNYHLGPGKEALATGAYTYAVANFEFILNHYPNHPLALDLMSQTCALWKNTPRCDADAWFEKAIGVNPNAAPTYIVLGLHYHRRGKFAEEIHSYQKALELQPQSLNAYYNLGLAYAAQKQYALANEAAQHAYALGAQLPGLREKLKSDGAWKPIDTPLPPAEAGKTSPAPS